MKRIRCSLLVSFVFVLLLSGCNQDDAKLSDGDLDTSESMEQFEWNDAELNDSESDAQQATPELDSDFKEKMAEAQIPGMAALVLQGNRICWSRNYGWANVESKIPVDDDTLFMIASISKTFIATAALKAVELGMLNLDEPVNTYLPFTVVHPQFPDTDITIRMLLTHTGGIKDNWTIERQHYVNGDSPISLGQYLKDYLTPDGSLYNAETAFQENEPGTRSVYSCIGAGLAAYAIERAVNKSYAEFVRESVFSPLNMTNTAYHLADLTDARIATPYLHDSEGAWTAMAQYGYPNYPSGGLHTTIHDLASYLMAYLGDGEYNGARILEKASVDEALRLQIPDLDEDQALIWNYKLSDEADRFGHAGNDDGISTMMYARRESQVGVIVLCNGDIGGDLAAAFVFSEFVPRLFEESETLCAQP